MHDASTASELRLVIVSLGSIGQRHLRNLRTLCPQARIAVWRRPHAAATVPEGADLLCRSLEEVLAFRPQAALVAGPSPLHLEAARPLAEAGVHLFLEKPISDRAQGVDSLIECCRRQGRVLMVGYNLRFLPSLRETKRLIDEGAIGRVLSARAEVGQYLPSWRPAADYRQGVTARKALGGGVLLELSHDIDYILWILGQPARLTACGGRYSDLEVDVEDMAELLLEYTHPARLVSIHLDMVQRHPVRRCRFVGSEGVLVWDCIADHIECYRAADGAWNTFDAFKLEDKNRMYLDELRHFLDCVQHHRTPLCSGEDGLAVMSVIEAARRSIATGSAVALSGSTPA